MEAELGLGGHRKRHCSALNSWVWAWVCGRILGGVVALKPPPSFGHIATLCMLKGHVENLAESSFCVIGGGFQGPLFHPSSSRRLHCGMTFGGLLTEGEEILPAAARMGPAREATAEPKEGSHALSDGNPPTHRGKVPGGRGAGLVFPSQEALPSCPWPTLSRPVESPGFRALLIPGSLEEQPCPAAVPSRQGGWHARARKAGPEAAEPRPPSRWA